MKRALISVSDKTGIVEFARALIHNGYEIISTGNTHQLLIDSGVSSLSVESVTDFSEMLDGRVKTLHPAIHGGLLAKRDQPLHMEQIASAGIVPIDLVCINLYPFKQTLMKPGASHEEIIENIDIGGPAMLRSAAKNYPFVSALCDPADFTRVLDEIQETGDTSLRTREYLALKVFNHTAHYDAMITSYLKQQVTDTISTPLTLTYELHDTLRYGENPHQKAMLYHNLDRFDYAITSCDILHGKALSYNNIQDGQAALSLLSEFDEPTCVVIKHMNPCGVACGDDVSAAYQRAYEADPVSIFGGIVAVNGTVDGTTAQAIHQIFIEVLIAKEFTEAALDILTQKKNIRLLKYHDDIQKRQRHSAVHIPGGLLVQDVDSSDDDPHNWKGATVQCLSSAQLSDALFADKIVKHVKSNAIVLVKDKQTIGIGAGQMNRVGAARIACEMAQEKANGSLLGSDAFFPMRDTVDLVAEYGITAIVQPGGSIKDNDSIEACNEHGIAMVFSGKRHFKH